MNANQPREVTAAITQLRAEIEQLPQDNGGKRKGIPDDLKRRAAAVLLGSAMRLDDFARAISVSESAMSCWRRQFGIDVRANQKKEIRGLGFKKVTVDPKPEPTTRNITIEGPHGMRITGLNAGELAQLWRLLC